MFFFLKPTRRGFLQTIAAASASLVLPRFLWAKESPPAYWFIHAETGESWPVADPVAWCLENATQPILERASERLLTLTPADDERIVRLVTRRCKLNLIQVSAAQVEVHHWGPNGLGDLRPFFKSHALARGEIEVVVKERKRELTAVQTGDDFLYGTQLPLNWPWRVYLKKWQRRYERERDDWTAAPFTWSGYAWEGVEDNCIPWAAMKSAWRRTSTPLCQNCDGPTILTNFGWPMMGMFNRYPRFLHACWKCRRSFQDHSIKDMAEWMRDNLDSGLQPQFIMIWDRRKKLEV